MEFKVGDLVKHKLTGENCLILRKGHEQLLVRTMNYEEIWVYEYELASVESK